MNGVSFVASRELATQENVQAVMNVAANYAAVMPFGFIREINSPELVYDTDGQWLGETKIGAKQYIELLHSNNIEVMLKPHIWIWRGVFTGSMKMDSEEKWKILEESYEKFILNYAELAKETQVSLFCIGTELDQFIRNRPEYWKGLIKKIRTVYKGKLTYAANWDEWPRTPFWEDLDYIGIDAYFPLTEEKVPSVEQFREGWKRHKEKISKLAKEKDRPVLFTEYGYRSMEYNGKRPWVVDRHEAGVNLDAQANATTAILEEFWKENWFAGGFVWKWFIHHEKAGGLDNNRFTPQNKPAEDILKGYYSVN